jgi:AAA+ superfamily predicted ATPase
MADDALSPSRFADAFMAFLEEAGRTVKSRRSSLADRVVAHLGGDTAALEVVSEQFDGFEHPNLQLALDAFIAASAPGADWVGIAGDQKQYVTSVLAMLLGNPDGRTGPPLAEGPIDRVAFHLSGGDILTAVQHGILLASVQGVPVVIALLGPSAMHGPRQQIQLEVVSPAPEISHQVLTDLRQLMHVHNVYRGHVISIRPGRLDMGAQTLVNFVDLPKVDRADVVLPDVLLERIERHALMVTRHSEALLKAGRSLKRGMLLHGPPGTGKTHSLMYLAGQMPGRTILLTTGGGYGLLPIAIQIARTLAPSMVVMEDVDLIAMERSDPFHGGGPLLFELMNEMDGLQDDVDILFVLTTNRPDSLEPALAARPGRVDLAVEFPLPDVEARVRLLRVYARGLELVDVDIEHFPGEIEGATPAYIKELLRRTAVIAIEDGGAVSRSHLNQAREELATSGELGNRMLGFGTGELPGMEMERMGPVIWPGISSPQ